MEKKLILELTLEEATNLWDWMANHSGDFRIEGDAGEVYEKVSEFVIQTVKEREEKSGN